MSLSIWNREAALSRIMPQEVQRYFYKYTKNLATSKKMKSDLLYAKSTEISNGRLFIVVRGKVRGQKKERQRRVI